MVSQSILAAQPGGDSQGYRAPALKPAGTPHAVYVAPMRRLVNGRWLVVGERLTSIENPLSADPRDERRYTRKGYRIATPSDIARLKDLEGHILMYDTPQPVLQTPDELMAHGRITGDQQAAKVAENRIKALEQELALVKAGKAEASPVKARPKRVRKPRRKGTGVVEHEGEVGVGTPA